MKLYCSTKCDLRNQQRILESEELHDLYSPLNTVVYIKEAMRGLNTEIQELTKFL